MFPYPQVHRRLRRLLLLLLLRLRLPPVRMQFLLVRLRRRHVHRLLLRVQQLQQLQFLPPLRLRELLHDLTIRRPRAPYMVAFRKPEPAGFPAGSCLVKAGAPWYTDFDSE